jgi:hypothetical protein
LRATGAGVRSLHLSQEFLPSASSISRAFV